MSFTVVARNNFLTLVPDGTGDWDSRQSFPDGMRLVSIQFFPSAANDKLVVRDWGAGGAEIMAFTDILNSGGVKYFFGAKCFPYIADADCLFDTASDARIIFQYE